MKLYLGRFVPKSDFDPNFNPKKMDFVTFKTEELNFLFRTFNISENQSPILTTIDQDQRLIPILIPLIACLTEVSYTPCESNIKKVLKQSPSFVWIPI